MSLVTIQNKQPKLHPTVYVAEGVQIIGEVEIGEGSSLWHNSVLRGDIAPIKIGRFTNLQDGAVVHVASDRGTEVGDYVTVGHKAILHACTVHDGALIGMGAIILDEAEIGEEAIIAAGALVTQGVKVPPRTIWRGAPARQVTKLDDQEAKRGREFAVKYAEEVVPLYARS